MKGILRLLLRLPGESFCLSVSSFWLPSHEVFPIGLDHIVGLSDYGVRSRDELMDRVTSLGRAEGKLEIWVE
jgi:hypothetical protein